MTTTASLADVVGVLEQLYPPRWAAEWDRVGLVVGDPAAPVKRILFAVDPVQAVANQAVALEVDLVVVHHPLLLKPVSSVSAESPKGRVIHQLIRRNIGLYVAHTNADSPSHGVSESMAFALGLGSLRPLVADAGEAHDKIVTFVPHGQVQRVIDALSGAGAGSIGDYDRAAFLADGEGTFRPGPKANPAIGTRGKIEVVAETKIEMIAPRGSREAVIRALLASHPYEEPAYDLIELAGPALDRGSGRIGLLGEPTRLSDFADQVAAALPSTPAGIRVSGDLNQQVQHIAVAGGAGDFLLDDVRRTGADVFVTSDLRHHPASEFREHPGAPALIDVPHWAAEWTWLPVVRDAVSDALERRGLMVHTDVSRICTDPWNHRASRTIDP